MIRTIQKNVTKTDIKNGFLALSARDRDKILEIVHHVKNPRLDLTYDLGCNRIFRLRRWFLKNKTEPEDIVFIKLKNKKIISIELQHRATAPTKQVRSQENGKKVTKYIDKKTFNKALDAFKAFKEFRKKVVCLGESQPKTDGNISEIIVCHAMCIPRKKGLGPDAIKGNTKYEIKGTISENGTTGIQKQPRKELGFDYLFWGDFSRLDENKCRIYKFSRKEIGAEIYKKKKQQKKRGMVFIELRSLADKKKRKPEKEIELK